MQGDLYILSSPSGGGKTTLVRQLVAEVNDIVISVSHTTRPMRPSEKHGVDYYFVSPEEFSSLQNTGAFLEHAQVFDNYYATARAEVLSYLDRGIDVILPIDWQGFRNIKALYPSAIGIFVLPPSLELLKARLHNRGQDTETTIAHRMQKAASEMSHYVEYDFLIINDDLSTALQDLKAIVRAERLRKTRQTQKHEALFHSLPTPYD